MEKIIKLPSEGIKNLHFMMKGMEFPVVIGTYSEWEDQQVSYLLENQKNAYLSIQDICQWCIRHNILFQVLYPIHKRNILKHPYKYYRYLKLKKQFNISL